MSDPTAWLTAGGVVFVHSRTTATSASSAATLASRPSSPPAPDRVSTVGMPIHHSFPGAANVMFLDFDGLEDYPLDAVGTANPPRDWTGLDLDGDPATFAAAEQALISGVWARLAEDWAPFGVDVTTEEPAHLGAKALWSVFSDTVSAQMPPFVGGVAPFNGSIFFGADPPLPSFTFLDTLGTSDTGLLADVASQEAGHILGLFHDGYGPHTYYPGHGSGPTSWGSVMGQPDQKNVTQFSRGDYPDSTNPEALIFGSGSAANVQDDLAIIASKLGWRPDDVANSIGPAATPLVFPMTRYIATPGDVDVFSLPAGGGDVTIEVNPFRADEGTDGGNLDVAALIYAANGNLIAYSDDNALTNVPGLQVTLPEGAAYLMIVPSWADPVAGNPGYPEYGSLGRYTITGVLPNQPPSFTAGPAIRVLASSGPYGAPWASEISRGLAHEADQQLSFLLSGLSLPSLFSSAPTIAPDGTLRFTPTRNAVGSATASVRLRDDGGTTGGGQDTSAAALLRISIEYGFAGFEPNKGDGDSQGRKVRKSFTLVTAEGTLAKAIGQGLNTRVQVLTAPGGALIKAGECDVNGKQNAFLCQLDLPTTLAAGSYWLAAQYRTPDGTWVTPSPTTNATTPNPAPITVR